MPVSHTLFAENDMVIWQEQTTERDKYRVAILRREYGEGPFRVVKVRIDEEAGPDRHPQMLQVCLDKDARLILPFPGELFTHPPTIH